MMRRVIFILSVLVLIGAIVYYWPASRPPAVPAEVRGVAAGEPNRSPRPGESRAGAGARPVTAQSGPEVATPPPVAGPAPDPTTDFPIAAPLNAPGSTVQRDLDILSQLFEAWQSNFPREGNPVGENADITAALMGDNRLGLALIPKGHRALNDQGELCDRWGTPFRFHQLSGTKMEVRSAGPDRKFATEDDAVWTPQ